VPVSMSRRWCTAPVAAEVDASERATPATVPAYPGGVAVGTVLATPSGGSRPSPSVRRTLGRCGDHRPGQERPANHRVSCGPADVTVVRPSAPPGTPGLAAGQRLSLPCGPGTTSTTSTSAAGPCVSPPRTARVWMPAGGPTGTTHASSSTTGWFAYVYVRRHGPPRIHQRSRPGMGERLREGKKAKLGQIVEGEPVRSSPFVCSRHRACRPSGRLLSSRRLVAGYPLEQPPSPSATATTRPRPRPAGTSAPLEAPFHHIPANSLRVAPTRAPARRGAPLNEPDRARISTRDLPAPVRPADDRRGMRRAPGQPAQPSDRAHHTRKQCATANAPDRAA